MIIERDFTYTKENKLYHKLYMSSFCSGSEADYERMAGNVYMYGNVALALAMARETGMVAVLCQSKEPMSSTDIANSAKLKER